MGPASASGVEESGLVQGVEQSPIHFLSEIPSPVDAGVAPHELGHGLIELLLFGGEFEVHVFSPSAD